MNKLEMKEKFDELYNRMSNSRRVANMRLFGDVMKEMMEFMIDEYPEDAESYLGTLEAVNWNNYLTMEEAKEIIDAMKPDAPWEYEPFVQAINNIGGVLEQEPFYNSYALWAVMSMVYSDSARTIASILGSTLEDISQDTLLKAIYLLAIDKLKDEDGKFSVRTYFGV